MKKLMIAAAIVCAAAFAQAGSAQWNIDSALTASGKDIIGTVDGKDYYAFLLVDADSTSTATIYSYTDAVEALGKKDASFLSNAMYSEQIDDGMTVYQVDGFGDAGTVNLYTVIIDAENPEDATMAYITPLESDVENLMGFIDYDLGDIASGNPGDWKAVNVPEPTTGLLLLLGMAGLALKRKVA